MRRGPLGWLFLFAVLGLWLNTRQNSFPFYYHPDEVKKVDQILSGERNFNHPLLMLHVVETAWKLSGQPTDRQAVVEIGRTISAVFSVLGTLAFFLAAWLWRGPLAGVATGAWLTCHQQIFELAHYFKEDPALYAGVGLFCWASVAYHRKPDATRLVGLILSLIWAASAKYLGLILLTPALILVASRSLPGRRKGVAIATLLLGFGLGFILVNLPIFYRLDIFEASLGKEMNWAVTGEKDVTRSIPHAIYLNIFVANISPPLWIFLGILLITVIRQKSADFLTWCFLGTFLGWFLLLSCSPKTNDRYFLPLTGCIVLLSAAGFAIWATQLRGQRVFQYLPHLVALFALGWEITRTHTCLQAFSTDDRADLVTWIRQNIPENETIGYESKVNLPDIEVYHDLPQPLPHRLLRKFFAADLGDDSYFKKENIRWLIITETTYGRFFLDSLRAKEGQTEEFARRAAFYEKIRRHPPLWSRPRSTVLYLHPGLEVYRYEP